jgi:hypothetical protein
MQVKFYKHSRSKTTTDYTIRHAFSEVPALDFFALFDSSVASALFLFLPNSILLYLNNSRKHENISVRTVVQGTKGELQVSCFLGHHEFLSFKFGFGSGSAFRRLLLLRLSG